MNTSEQEGVWKRWFVDRRHVWRRVVIGIAVAIVLVQWTRAARKPHDGDFFLHWKFAGRFVAGQMMYAEGLDIPYPPFWGMAWSPTAALPLRAAKTLFYPVSLASLAVVLFVLNRLTRRHLPLEREPLFWTTVIALALAARFLVRELPECGPNLALLALSWLAVYGWSQRREVMGGACLGFAIALKCTPALVLAWFAWKRQWKMVATTTAAAGAFTLAPAMWQGEGLYAQHVQLWVANVRLSAGNDDPSRGALGDEPVQNLALRPAIARYLMRLPPGHLGRPDHAWYADFLDLPPTMAANVCKGALLLLLAGVAWTFRQPVERRHDLAVVWECACVSVLALLLSPITWGQHCVALLPLLYLVSRTAVALRRPPAWAQVVLGFYVIVNLVLNRGLIGRDLTLLLHSYHLATLSFLGLLVIGLASRAQAARAAQLLPAPTRQSPPQAPLRRAA
ncbi:MAG: glycosyltransferase family 87 protein [Pirellulales bacterium]